MKAADVGQVVSLLEKLVEAITNRGDDPLVEIPRIIQSYKATERADKAIADYVDERFPSD